MSRADDRALADLAAGQWGLVTTPQAVAIGLSRVQLSRLCAAGGLVRLSHGVYALRGSTGTEDLDLLAAWLALDPRRPAADRLDDGPRGAVVSHASAAVRHGLGDLDADRHEFTTPTRRQTRRADVRLHRGVLAEEDVTLHRGLPITTPLRTVVDLLADGHDGGHVAGVLADALRRRLVDRAALAERIGPYARRFGLPRQDGWALLHHLEELGGVAELADADELAAVARAARVPVGALLAAGAVPDAVREALDRRRRG
jgi:predicted transcriptional regulator of viral defense system